MSILNYKKVRIAMGIEMPRRKKEHEIFDDGKNRKKYKAPRKPTKIRQMGVLPKVTLKDCLRKNEFY